MEDYTALVTALPYDEHRCAHRQDWREMVREIVSAHMYKILKTNPLFTALSISLTVQVTMMHLKC